MRKVAVESSERKRLKLQPTLQPPRRKRAQPATSRLAPRPTKLIGKERSPNAAFESLSRLLETLPKKGGARWEALVKKLRADLDPSQPGVSTIDTSVFFPPALSRAMFRALPHPGQASLLQGEAIKHDGKHIWTKMPDAQVRPFMIYADWIVALLNDALRPKRPFEASQIDLRLFSGRIADDPDNVAFPSWHTDGGELAVLVAPVGTGTGIVRDTPKFDPYADNVDEWVRKNKPDAAEWTPTGQTLIISGIDRGAKHPKVIPTVHSSPQWDEERMLLLLRIRMS
jgi:hypothetical protein